MVTKLHGGGQGVFVNSVFAGGKTATTDFTLYVNPYLVAQNGGRYTKHIYIGSQRIVSKLGDFESYGADPRRIEKAGEAGSGQEIDYETKYKTALATVKNNYAALDVTYNGLDNNDYVNGLGFCCNPNLAGKESSSATTAKTATNDNAELQQFYYHPDHLGSSSYISNLDGEVVQHIEHTPFGEIFIEEKNSKWNTPYLFTSKELDRESGMNYFSARYQDPKLGIFLGVDPEFAKFPGWSSYNYTLNNPINFIDPDGQFPKPWVIAIFEKRWGNASSIKFSNEIYAQMNKFWSQSFDKSNNSIERGATLTVNISKKSFEFINIDGKGSTSGTFQPGINIDDKKNVLIGTFHTHPYGKNDGNWNGAFIPFSGGDFATMDDFDEAVSVVQSGKNIYMLAMTSKTPKNLDPASGFYDTQFQAEYSKQLKNGLSEKEAAEKAGDFAVKKTAKEYKMMYFKGENGKTLQKQKL